ncbi:MAG: DUF5615 family PIN-like protein [Bryobacteraceae bacterium]
MKFLLDHDVPDDLSYLLQQLGHDVTLLRRALPGDSSDEAVLQFADERGCLLLTCNRDDFLNLATTRPHPGIVISHPPSNPSRRTGCVVSAAGTCWRDRSPKQRQLRLIDGDASAEARTLRFEQL